MTSREPAALAASPATARFEPRRPGIDYRRLDPDRIVSTLAILEKRIDERFPRSSLAALANELLGVAREARGRLRRIRRPNWSLRVSIVLLAALLVFALVTAFVGYQPELGPSHLVDFVQGVESAVNDVVLLAVGLFFLFTLEGRLKRRKVLAALHELRSLAHIVDMHQLTKDPEHILNPAMTRTASSPRRAMSRFELARYLDYCSELLSLAGKVASLHAQDLRDSVVLTAVNDVETLTIGLSRKIWQKIMILDEIRVRDRVTEARDGAPRRSPEPAAQGVGEPSASPSGEPSPTGS